MERTQTYPNGIEPRRPRPAANAGAGTILGALLGGVLTEHPVGAILGGVAGNAIASQPLSLETAIREYFTQQSLSVIGFYRQGYYGIKVLFQFGKSGFWVVESRVPKQPGVWPTEVRDDWLYGDVIDIQLPAKFQQINTFLAS